MSLGLGLDTGGTYTDAVILDLKRGKVVQKGKVLTTRPDLITGIGKVIDSFDKDLLQPVSIASLSTTLATNSIVEGQGCKVGLICIGRDFDDTFLADRYLRVDGGHNINGNEVISLDKNSIRNFAEEVKDDVDCFAITGYMSVRNPDHEFAAAEIVSETAEKPIVCGYQLSSILGFKERTVTAVMNAKLIPVIDNLIRSVGKVLAEKGLDIPIMIVKGDGSMMSIETAKKRPVETILSGPAASLTGAREMTGLNEAVVVDMGGTTTDIGILRNGFPSIDKEGALIGCYKTHVMAAEISTTGLGGDSRVFLNGRKMKLMSSRAVPLCIAATAWPEILDDLKAAAENIEKVRESIDDNHAVSDIEFLTVTGSCPANHLSSLDRDLMKLISERPYTLKRAGELLETNVLQFDVPKLEKNGLVRRVGLTPTDVLHSEGSYREYDYQASDYGIEYFANRTGLEKKEVIAKIKDMVCSKISMSILSKVIMDETGSTDYCMVAENLLEKAVSGNGGKDFSCKIALNKPIIGIGAPVNAWLPDVSKRLHTDFVPMENSQVGNAIGAVSGCILESIDILIEPRKMSSSSQSSCTAYSKLGRFAFDSVDEGIAYAKSEGGKFVEKSVIKAGASSVNVVYDIKERTFEQGNSTAVIDIVVSVTATGKPRQMI
ncbi:MAG: hydantoinase/oxoprolinase N-terminal domain-containing protein [Candidatus Methanomethylophilaceae archaeon]|jgi:N-methylhydantoinase A/oxoprolinase/acetone carboxylase beta subunit